MEDVQEICRTCLRVRDDDEFIYIMNSADYTNPNRTYADILIDLGKLEIIDEDEFHMPQHICSECRKQLHQMYLFVEQIQQCNAELSKRLGFTVSESNDETQDAELSHKIDESIDVHKQQRENQDFFEVSIDTANSTRDGVEENNYEAMEESEIETQENVDKTSSYSVDANKVYSDCNNDQEKAHRNILTEDELETMSIENTIQMILADDSDESHSSKILTSSDRTNFERDLELQKKFTDNQSLNVHHTVDCNVLSKENVYTIESGHFKCRQCEYSTKSLAAFYLHKLSNHSTEEDKNKCKFCSYINCNKFETFIHIKELHLSDIKALRLNLEKEELARESEREEFNGEIRKKEGPVEKNAEHIDTEVCSSDDEKFIKDLLDIREPIPTTKVVNESDRKADVIISNDKTENSSCPLCEQVLAEDDLDTHMLLEHREECSAQSTEYSIESEPDEELYSDSKKHVPEKRRSRHKKSDMNYKCDLCDYTANTRVGLYYHRRSKHGSDEDKLKCSFCSYKVHKNFNLLVHTRRNHLAIIKEIKRNLRRTKEYHKETAIYDSDTFKEDITILIQKYHNYTDNESATNLEVSSGDEDTIRGIINMEKKIPKAESTKSFARRCDECGNVYKDSKSLKTHMRMVHGEHEYNQCPHCPRKYKRRSDLKLHIAGKHIKNTLTEAVKSKEKTEREKRYMCTECSYVCSTLTCLTIHTHRNHTGERPYQCEFCPKAFVIKGDLKTHRYLHTGERPSQCPICLKGFRSNSLMHRHKRSHSDTKRYICSVCGKGFTKNYNLTAHKKRHQEQKCFVCHKYFKDKAELNLHQISEGHQQEIDE